MTNREKLINREKMAKEFIVELDDDFLFSMFCAGRDCIGCVFRDSPLGCEDGFMEWLDEVAEEEEK